QLHVIASKRVLVCPHIANSPPSQLAIEHRFSFLGQSPFGGDEAELVVAERLIALAKSVDGIVHKLRPVLEGSLSSLIPALPIVGGIEQSEIGGLLRRRLSPRISPAQCAYTSKRSAALPPALRPRHDHGSAWPVFLHEPRHALAHGAGARILALVRHRKVDRDGPVRAARRDADAGPRPWCCLRVRRERRSLKGPLRRCRGGLAPKCHEPAPEGDRDGRRRDFYHHDPPPCPRGSNRPTLAGAVPSTPRRGPRRRRGRVSVRQEPAVCLGRRLALA